MSLFHVTKASNLPSIRKNGIVPKTPEDMGENLLVYIYLLVKFLQKKL